CLSLHSSLLTHVAAQLAFRKRDANAIAWFHFLGPPDHMSAGFVPHDSIAAPKDGEWAEAVEPSGAALQPPLRRMAPMERRRPQRPVHPHEPRAHGSEAPTQVELFELQPQILINPQPFVDAGPGRMPQRMRRFRTVPASQRQASRPP